MKVYFDSNVLVSALLRPEGPPGELLRLCYEGEFDLILSRHLLTEILRVCSYPKIRKRLARSDRDIARWVESLEDLGDVVEESPAIEPVIHDADDLLHLAAAAAGRADVLVTGDKELLELGEFQGVKIMSPSELLGLPAR